MPIRRNIGGYITANPTAPTTSKATGVWSLVQQLQASAASIWPVTADPDFDYVSLLLPGNGTNGAQNNTFLDSSTNNFTVTRNGDTTQGSFSPYGDLWSNYFDGTGDYLTAPSNAAFAYSGAFTIEFWIFPTTQLTSDGSNTTALFYVNGTNGLQIGAQSTTAWGIANRSVGWRLTTTTLPTVNAWNHVAITRNSSNNTSIFLNGVRVANGTVTDSFGAGDTYIGYGAAYVLYYNGYISNFRSVNTANVYDPAVATITVPTAPLTAISGTSLLTCQSNRFRDASTNNFAITRNGDVRVTNFAPFNPSAPYDPATNGGSGYFDGSGDYLATPANAAFTFGTGDYTVEAWVYFTGTATDQNIVDMRGLGGTGNQVRIAKNSNNLNLGWASIDNQISTTWPGAGGWIHIAAVRSGTTVAFFVNGVRAGTKTDTTNLAQGTPIIGAYSATIAFFSGYIGNVSIVKGTAVYDPAQTTITPPTAPVTAITNTSLLLNFTNAGIVDASAKNDLVTVGNAQISTAQSKFGGSSMAFDGTGDYLSTPDSPNFDFGAGNFTIEAWVSFAVSTSGADYPIVIQGTTAFTSNASFAFTRHNSNKLRFIFTDDGTGSSGYKIVDSTNNFLPSVGVWYHLAVTRSGNTFRLFIDGVQAGSNTYSQAIYNGTRPITIGADDGASIALNGYIDDLRVTKGVARYTANFTPPTAPFPLG